MRITYRSSNIKEYWNDRWSSIPVDMAIANENKYPLKYAIDAVALSSEPILEAGCGAGRVLRYFHQRSKNIYGIDYIDCAINKLKEVDKTLNVQVEDIKNLSFQNETFGCVLAFGLYHGLENGLSTAIKETHRVIKPNGYLCASFRSDNIQTRINDFISWWKNSKKFLRKDKFFHKMNLTKSEFVNLLEKNGFRVLSIEPVENMPILYKFAFFRNKRHRHFDENLARSEGYKLSFVGKKIQNLLMHIFPNQFCNIYVAIANKI